MMEQADQPTDETAASGQPSGDAPASADAPATVESPPPPPAGAGATPALQEEAAADGPAPGLAPEPAPDRWPADGVLRQPDPRSVRLNQTVSWITTACITAGLLIGTLVFALAGDSPGWVMALVVAGEVAVIATLVWASARWPTIDHRYSFYLVDARGLEIRHGVWWRSVVNVPRSRVQHTDVSQGPLERSYGLGTLIVYTAGTDHAQVNLEGLDHATALAIRDHLLPRAADDAV
jgi:uncharacterized protein